MDMALNETGQKCLPLTVNDPAIFRQGTPLALADLPDPFAFDDHPAVWPGIGACAVYDGRIGKY
jgi:hypothetical protein